MSTCTSSKPPACISQIFENVCNRAVQFTCSISTVQDDRNKHSKACYSTHEHKSSALFTFEMSIKFFRRIVIKEHFISTTFVGIELSNGVMFCLNVLKAEEYVWQLLDTTFIGVKRFVLKPSVRWVQICTTIKNSSKRRHILMR